MRQVQHALLNPMEIVKGILRDFAEALRFLTVLPLPRPSGKRERGLARAMFFFPLVGFLIGIVSLWLYAWLRPFFSERAANLVLLAAPIVLSGGLHLDGFADFCDGFFSAKNKEETLRVMKDSRIGVWGAAALCLLLIAKFELLQDLPLKANAFLLALTASRWSQVVLCYFLPYGGRGGGLGETVAHKVGQRELAGASFFLFFATLPLEWTGLSIFLGLLFFLGFLAWLFVKRVGGVTGDLLGAASEWTEFFILAFVTLLHRGGSF